MKPWENRANTLLVLAGQDYLDALRERGVFEYGIARMHGDPNEGWTLPVRVRYLFEEIDASGIGQQQRWLTDAVKGLNAARGDDDGGQQYDFSTWTDDEHACESCGGQPPDVQPRAYGDLGVYCDDGCQPRQCARCSDWTHETGLGSYPLCTDCQTASGGQKRTPLYPETTEQTSFPTDQ